MELDFPFIIGTKEHLKLWLKINILSPTKIIKEGKPTSKKKILVRKSMKCIWVLDPSRNDDSSQSLNY